MFVCFFVQSPSFQNKGTKRKRDDVEGNISGQQRINLNSPSQTKVIVIDDVTFNFYTYKDVKKFAFSWSFGV